MNEKKIYSNVCLAKRSLVDKVEKLYCGRATACGPRDTCFSDIKQKKEVCPTLCHKRNKEMNAFVGGRVGYMQLPIRALTTQGPLYRTISTLLNFS